MSGLALETSFPRLIETAPLGDAKDWFGDPFVDGGDVTIFAKGGTSEMGVFGCTMLQSRPPIGQHLEESSPLRPPFYSDESIRQQSGIGFFATDTLIFCFLKEEPGIAGEVCQLERWLSGVTYKEEIPVPDIADAGGLLRGNGHGVDAAQLQVVQVSARFLATTGPASLARFRATMIGRCLACATSQLGSNGWQRDVVSVTLTIVNFGCGSRMGPMAAVRGWKAS